MIGWALRNRRRLLLGAAIFVPMLFWGGFIWRFDFAGPELWQEAIWSVLVLGPGAALGWGPLARLLDRRFRFGRSGSASFVAMMAAMAGSGTGFVFRPILGLGTG